MQVLKSEMKFVWWSVLMRLRGAHCPLGNRQFGICQFNCSNIYTLTKVYFVF